MSQPLEPYEPTAHPVSITPAAGGGWLPYCGTCSAREGDWVSPCRSWSPTTPLRLFDSGEIGTMLAGAQKALAG